jgi:SSS family transporter
MLTLATSFRPADWAVLGAYLLMLVFTGWWFSRRESKSTGEYFLADRRMPMWAVSVSIIATSLSAATFVGAPEQSYTGDLTYLSTNIGGLIAVVIVAYLFIPAFYRNNCTTVYELLEKRFGTGSKAATSAAFMIGRLFASGARIYIAAIPLSMILFGTGVVDSENYVWCMIAAIAALTAVGTFYTLFGGISSVIWTDVIQTGVLVVAVTAAIVVLFMKIDAPVGEIFASLRSAVPAGQAEAGAWGKLTVFRPGLDPGAPGWGFDPSAAFTILTAIAGFALLNVAAYGTDHDMVQRMLTCRNAIQGGRSVLWSMAVGIPLVSSFMLVGLLLWVYYQQSAAGAPPEARYVFVGFIIDRMPAGLAGLMLAGLFAAGVGSLTSAINAMAATFVKDFYTRWVPGRPDTHYLAAGRWAVVGWGASLGGFAVLCLLWQQASPGTTLIGLALGVMTFAYAGLLGVFCTAMFTRRGNATSVVLALVTGFVAVGLLQDWAWPRWTPLIPVIGPDLAGVKIAFPWHMTIGSVLAFMVCAAGRPVRRGDDTPLPASNTLPLGTRT